ncbi:hypothetical protein A3A21_03965 [Candidatus Jorgensenbacteria bacterium RIFCSPLOWO2_01_FULL_45_25b]|uniref:FtsK domain-containing protein n=1 Tax=Candidatus Jorgensenbacteria bacterium RIFCSPLOWO2_01_FULL_45_25b TaxID=1798471 RepID=A0A1F6BWT0_9BACT|nr:MAG: hypothetical protein A3A21_03965 [Candidatus Jorgensenbacteria bacterium RIFCSPLOWO2_01_FULL_45_25b]
MAKKKQLKKKQKEKEIVREKETIIEKIHPEIKRAIFIIALAGLAILLVLAAIGKAGPLGDYAYKGLHKLFGIGYYLLPTVSLLFALTLIVSEGKKIFGTTAIGGLIFILSGLGFLDIIAEGRGGLTGSLVGTIEKPFGTIASLIIMGVALVSSLLIIVNKPISIRALIRKREEEEEKPEQQKKEKELEIKLPLIPEEVRGETEKKDKKGEKELEIIEPKNMPKKGEIKQAEVRNYVPPPLSLLVSSVEKPTIGDLRANANIIKRTLESFGIVVEMGEINVGPTVTRYTLKPAEGVKLTRLTSLNQDLALALAAHPIRIEAPIPGKSLVGIEVPNKSAATVRLGSLLLYPEFHTAPPLTFALGRDVNGDPVFGDISKMPHMLIAGATGSGKSIMIQGMIISLLYKNSPEMLRMIMVDPKRVELSIYNDIPHLLTPVITENKKSIGALRWAIQEMERRYQILMEAGSRDIKSYNNKIEEKLPYIVIVIDELADLMVSYGKEVEGSIIRLAQMARATGIHLVVSTQRPSVEVITGLIKANIPSRIALQVASQVDSRTILDSAGAEKLLGNGDLLFTSAELSKPRRVQGSFISEEELKKVITFIKKNNRSAPEEKEEAEEAEETIETLGEKGGTGLGNIDFKSFNKAPDEDDDKLYEEALEIARQAGKISASFLQRRLRVGYARAARLLDMMEERGVIGQADGAKPREVFM